MKKIILLTALLFNILQFSFAQSGRLDSSFNGKGWVTANFPKYNLQSEKAWQILVKNDNSYIIVVGDDNLPRALAHFFPNGTLDKDFGEDGYAVVKPINLAKAALQNDGKIVVTGTSGYYDSTDFAVARYNTNGSLDSSFGNNGIQTTNFLLKENATTVAIQNDGKIVVGGYTSDNGQNEYDYPNTYFAVARYNTDGTLDNTFNHNGKQITDFQLGEPPGEKYPGTPEFDYANAIAIQDDGKIVLAGNNINHNVFALARYKANGTPDSTFNGKGRQTTNIGEESYASSVAIDGNGKIILAGYARFPNFEFALVRYNQDGSPDAGFSNDGIQITDFGATCAANSIAIQPDNKIVLAGYTGNATNSDFAIARYNNNGSPDNSFSGDGKLITDFFGSGDVANSVALLKDGKIVVVGEAVSKDSGNYNGDLAFAAYNRDGSPDNDFSDDGKETAYIPTANGTLQSIAVQADKRIVVAGGARNSKDRDKIFISRYNINGSPDSSFGYNGIVMSDFGYSNEYCYAMAVQQDGKIVVAGEVLGGHNTTYNIDSSYALVARYNTDGSADSTFGKNGSAIPYFTTFLNWAVLSVAVQNDGKIVVGGFATDSSFQDDFAIARFASNGSLDSTFDDDGKQTSDIASSDDRATSIAVREDGKIFAGGYAALTGVYNFAITSYNSNGSLDKSFSNDGKLTINFGSDDNPVNGSISSIAIQKNGKAVVAGTSLLSGVGNNNNFALARFNNDGGLDDTFDHDGKLTAAFGDDAYASSVQIQSDGKIVAAGVLYNENYSTDIAIVRYNSNGSPDSAFGVHGKIISDLGGNEAVAEAALDNNRLYVAGSDIVAVYDLSDKSIPPVVSLTAPTNNATYIAPVNLQLTATAADADGTITKVEFYSGGTLLYIDSITPYNFTWKSTPAGNYTLTAKATDNSGLATISAPVHIVIVPNRAPVVRITNPVNNRTFADPAYIHFEALASDIDGRITRVEFYSGSTLLATEYKPPYKFVWKNLPVGIYTVIAVATDNFGAQTTSAPVTVKVKAFNTSIVSSKPNAETNVLNTKTAISLKAWPNPANKTLTVSTTGLHQNKPATISILSATGVVMKTMRINNSTTQLDVSSLTSGVYTIKLLNEDKVLYKQFVKL